MNREKIKITLYLSEGKREKPLKNSHFNFPQRGRRVRKCDGRHCGRVKKKKKKEEEGKGTGWARRKRRGEQSKNALFTAVAKLLAF
jgi:hypothetical protein